MAKEVHIAARSKPSETYEKLPGADNLWLHPMVKKMKEKKLSYPMFKKSLGGSYTVVRRLFKKKNILKKYFV